MDQGSSALLSTYFDTDAQRAAIWEQLDRLLADSLFNKSKRYPALLRYIVEQSLAGVQEDLKERTIGIEVFGRPPDYDTAIDPIVRNTASEVRKRIALYYDSPAHKGELAITLPIGSYVPHFDGVPEEYVAPPLDRTAAHPRRSNGRTRAFILSATTLAACAAIFATYLRSPTPLDRFWQPIMDTEGVATISIAPSTRFSPLANGAPSDPGFQASVPEFRVGSGETISLFDTRTVACLTALLQSNKRRAEIRSDSTTTLDDLRRGPIILVGGFSNEWTMRLTSQLRFTFESDGLHTLSIRDRNSPLRTEWKVDFSSPHKAMTDDYALISRIWDSSTGRPLVVVAGLAAYGTAAAGEFVTSPSLMRELRAVAPQDWDRKNMQIVLGIPIVSDHLGQSRILATHFW